MRRYSTKKDRETFVANWYRTVDEWQQDLKKARQ